MEITVVEQLAIFAKSQPDKAAIILHNEKLSYGDLFAFTRVFCAYLLKKGIKKSDFVVCRASATVSYWVAFFGTALAGGVFVPVEKDCTIEAVSALLQSLGDVFAVISSEADRQAAMQAGSEFILNTSVRIIAEEQGTSGVVFTFPSVDDIGQILFTTGTTGKAKGVVLRHSYMTRSAFCVPDIPYGKDIVMIVPASMNHVLAIGRCTSLIFHGGTTVLLEGLSEISDFYDALSVHKANAMTLTPSALNYIITLTGEEFDKYTKQIIFIEIGGEKLPKEQQVNLIKLLPTAKLFIMYASTETGATCYYQVTKHGATDNCIGEAAVNTSIHFMNENWENVPATRKDPAYIVVQSDHSMVGYWNDEAATDKVMREGMVMMSDYGYRDERGFVCISGRAGDVIISGGYKINPSDVENAALSTGMLSDCVCFGQKDAVFGKLVALLVVMKEGIQFDVFAIKKHLVDNLESYKVPKVIRCVDKVIRNRMGKIDRSSYI